MLTAEENELLVRVGPGTPCGTLLRRYWMPACLSADVAEPDGTPYRATLLGERYVVFRDSSGAVGMFDEACPHRLASLALGRNEAGGLRCIYHGWKFDVAGRCLEMPTEPDDSTYRERLRARSYAVREAGGIVWVYLGPPELEPAFPAYDWVLQPARERVVLRIGEYANWVQALEGAIDSAHSWFLHRGAARDWEKRTSVSTDLAPKLEAEDTAYGFRYAAIRRPNADPERSQYVRVTNMVMPFTALIPRPFEADQAIHVQIFVPVDDTRTMFYGIYTSQNGTALDGAAYARRMGAVPGVDLDRAGFRINDETRDYGQDRAAMKAGDWSGIVGIPNQDMACQESMGAIVDRRREHLGTSDVAVIRMRRRMLENVRGFLAGKPPIGLERDLPYGRIRSEQKVIPKDQPWQSVGAFADEFVES